MTLRFHITGTKRHKHCFSMTKLLSSMKTSCVIGGVEELECSAQSFDRNRSKDLWDEPEHQLNLRTPHPTLVPNLTNPIMAD